MITDTSSLTEVFNKAIQIFSSEGRKIEGIYDLLIRGSFPRKDACLIEHHSDLDTSVIVEEINVSVLKQVRFFYENIKKSFPYKLSITVVSKIDYLSSYHHHGIKPIYYSYLLDSTTSIIQNSSRNHSQISLDKLRLDCFSNIAYLIHDMRNKYLILNMEDKEATNEFFCHLIKRAKHLIRNAIFITTNHIDEEINNELFKKCFPTLDPFFPNHLKSYKINFEKITTSENVIEHIDLVLAQLEKIHEYLLTNYLCNDFKNQCKKNNES
jgi:hypothetical protein